MCGCTGSIKKRKTRENNTFLTQLTSSNIILSFFSSSLSASFSLDRMCISDVLRARVGPESPERSPRAENATGGTCAKKKIIKQTLVKHTHPHKTLAHATLMQQCTKSCMCVHIAQPPPPPHDTHSQLHAYTNTHICVFPLVTL